MWPWISYWISLGISENNKLFNKVLIRIRKCGAGAQWTRASLACTKPPATTQTEHPSTGEMEVGGYRVQWAAWATLDPGQNHNKKSEQTKNKARVIVQLVKYLP